MVYAGSARLRSVSVFIHCWLTTGSWKNVSGGPGVFCNQENVSPRVTMSGWLMCEGAAAQVRGRASDGRRPRAVVRRRPGLTAALLRRHTGGYGCVQLSASVARGRA